MSEIRYWNRAKQREETEKVYGDGFVRWLYGSRLGQWVSEGPISGHAFSDLYGAFQASRLSRGKVAPFIREFGIPMGEYVEQDYASFNDFFIRRFRPGARPFTEAPGEMPAFCEARYYGFASIEDGQKFPVKGQYLSAEALLGDAGLAREFRGGPLLLARLCPVDYHRFHFPDDGRVVRSLRVGGRLHSVNPLALAYRGDILATNERQVSILETAHFGRLAYVEVGALCVGKIVQSHTQPEFRRGDEKGYFLFGGSTVVVLGEPGRWQPAADVLEQTSHHRETLVKLGETLAISKK